MRNCESGAHIKIEGGEERWHWKGSPTASFYLGLVCIMASSSKGLLTSICEFLLPDNTDELSCINNYSHGLLNAIGSQS